VAGDGMAIKTWVWSKRCNAFGREDARDAET
jgi:hypothetical protein